MQALRITGINVYPIKSTAAVAVGEWPVEARGLAMDRRWMLVDEAGDFLTGREHTGITLVRTHVEDDCLRLTAPGMDELLVPVGGNAIPTIPVTVWADECHAVPVSEQADDWFSALIGTRCRLVHMNDDCARPVDPDYARGGDQVSFADGYPLLLISEASLTDLNTRLPEPFSMRRFRPNLVVAGCAPYAEDDWRQIRIGAVQFECVKACSRCEFTTIHPVTGEKDPRLEPLRTLSTYRRRPDGGVYFGQNLIPRSLGTVRVGDSVEIG
jgi:uncharacterized protein YcbX